MKQTVLRWSLAADRLFGVSAGDAVGEQLPRVAQRLLSPWDRIQSALAGYAPTRFICDETGLVVSVFPGGDHHVLLVAPRTGSLAS